jgi:hypothetical protein
MNINKIKTPRDTLMMLKYPNTDPPILERNSGKMAKLAKDYHYRLELQLNKSLKNKLGLSPKEVYSIP